MLIKIKIDKNIDNKPQISANLFNINIFNGVGNNCIFKNLEFKKQAFICN